MTSTHPSACRSASSGPTLWREYSCQLERLDRPGTSGSLWQPWNVGHQFSDLPAWEFSTLINEPGAAYTVRAVRDGGVSGEMSGEDLDDLFDRARQWAHSIDVGQLLRQALEAVEPLMTDALRAVGNKPAPGSALDQLGLADGGAIVNDYVEHGELGLAFDHLLYMVVEPSLPITAETLEVLQELSDRLATGDRQLAQARSLVVDP